MSRNVCTECEGSGEIYEICACAQCEYDGKHSHDVPCLDCDATGWVGFCPACELGVNGCECELS